MGIAAGHVERARRREARAFWFRHLPRLDLSTAAVRTAGPRRPPLTWWRRALAWMPRIDLS
jgi:hypothetical protein